MHPVSRMNFQTSYRQYASKKTIGALPKPTEQKMKPAHHICFKGVNGNHFQEAERSNWPTALRYLTPQYSPDSYIIITPEMRNDLLNDINEGINHIKAGKFEEAAKLFYSTDIASDAGITLLVCPVLVRKNDTLADITQQLIKLKDKHIINETRSRTIILIAFSFKDKLKKYNPERLRMLYASMAYTGLEEWLHSLQKTFNGSISRKFQGIPYEALNSDMSESDITAFMLEQQIPLPANHFDCHPSRKNDFPNWKDLKQSTSQYSVIVIPDD